MKTGLLLSFLATLCLMREAQSDIKCDLTNGKYDVPFPDILKYSADAYIMGVEYSVPGAKQTDYYTEYYEYEFKRGRLDGHQAGQKFRYVYSADTFEAWNIGVNKCEFVNVTETPEFFRDDMTEWVHSRGTEQFTTIGPSAMFKVALDVWKDQASKKNKTMAYMGPSSKKVRGEDSVFFRRCISNTSYAEYFYASEKEQTALDEDDFDKFGTPLRVAFYNLEGKETEMSQQFYDIISFRHQIPKELNPFQLPKGKNCTHIAQVADPSMPDFSINSILLSAEVLYRKIDTKNDGNQLMSSYYSTLTFALDRETNHVAYQYSSWNTTKPDKEHQEPFVNSPKYMVYDMTHKYAYKVDYLIGKCFISRQSSFLPSYRLPEDGGNISLTDPYLFLPNNEFSYLTKETDRGVTVNVFEAAMVDYELNDGVKIPKMFASRSYFTDDVKVENTLSVKNALRQVELHFFRKPDVEEILTFNIFGFTTKMPKKMKLFDITSCFKNEDDYLYLTLGFEPDPMYMPELEKQLSDVEKNVLTKITTSSELNTVRIPYTMIDVKDGFIYLTMLVLGKPPLILDFTDGEEDKTVAVATENDVQGVSNFKLCANNCLETKSGCWGFSMCGSTCYYGTIDSTEVTEKKGCTLYRRFTNDTYVQSKEVQANNIVGQVEAGEFSTSITLTSGTKIELKATVAQITDPGEDDDLFEKMGNLLNSRMRVFKPASKLKKGSSVKNLGKLRYDECQKLCLDFKECETTSYCLINSDCKISSKYAVDLKPEEFEDDNLCTVLTRKYADHFDRTPGVFASSSGGTKAVADSVEDCARECLRQGSFKCLSFDHCAGGDRKGCYLYTTYQLKSGGGKPPDGKSPRCGHYSRKYSTEFKKKEDSRIVGGNFKSILNITLEECAQRCYEYPGGACFGYDFCQDTQMYATSCILLDNDPSRFQSTYSPICTHFGRTAAEYAPRPYTTGYAGGIGFLCFLVGGVIGVVIIFGIAYIRVNRR